MRAPLSFLVALLLSWGSLAHLPARLQAFTKELEAKTKELQGGAIAIICDGEVIYQKVFGHEKGRKGPITEQTLFPLASVSKLVSAAAIALLVERGDVDLDEHFKLPWLKHPVSLVHLLSHTTGYTTFIGNAEIEQGLNRDKLLALLKQQTPSCKPGDCYRYNNLTFSLVDEALAHNNTSLEEALGVLREALNLAHTGIPPLPKNLPVAHPHYPGGKKRPPQPAKSPSRYPEVIPASAGIFVSLEDIIEIFKLSFGYRPDILSPETLARFHKAVRTNNDSHKWKSIEWPVARSKLISEYALGFRRLRVKGKTGSDLIFHPGFIGGINSFIGYVPSAKMGIIILANQRSPLPFKSGVKFWSLFL